MLGHLLPSFMCFVSEILSFIPIRIFEINFYHDYKLNLIDFIYYKLKKNMNTKENKWKIIILKKNLASTIEKLNYSL